MSDEELEAYFTHKVDSIKHEHPLWYAECWRHEHVKR